MPDMIVDSAIYVDGHWAAESASLDKTYEASRSQVGVAWIGLYKPTPNASSTAKGGGRVGRPPTA